MNPLQHIAISASAGSGKTYQLTNRFIKLLHLTEKPERIIALTFTRTAAGEFFQKIIEKLSDAASDQSKANSLSKELSITASSTHYHHLLELLISRMHQLNLQTLDSFFFRVVSSFALELGLSGSLNLLDESSEPRIRNEVRDSIVHSPSESTTELNEFWHAFKQATYGKEERSIERIISDYIESLYSLYLDAPQAELWGKPEQIWPQACPWELKDTTNWDQLADALREAVPQDLNKSQLNDFESAATKVQAYPVEEKLNALLTNALAVAPDLATGRAVLKVRKEIELPSATCTALADCLRAIIWHHLQRALQNTQGVHRILQAYHENYDRIVRRPGRLAFADLTHLLAPDREGSPMGTMDQFTRQLIDFRLDGQFDHWLFDEFQDTSRPQWEVIANLIDEIAQDSSGQRSLFYVGDIKQCLYLWRNSDDRLFYDIQAQYPSIEPQPLSTSWRSAPAILNAVNQVFSDNALIAECFSADAAARWARAWQTHEASIATKNLSGYACWLQSQKDHSPTRNELILKTLLDLDPIKRGMSIGVLARKNADANEIADYLRENSTLPVHTGSAIRPGIDNAAGATLLKLLRLAAHPGDAHARGYLALIENSTQGNSLIGASSELRSRLLAGSSESAITWAAKQIIARLPDDDIRHRQRLDLLIEKARAFDAEERRDIDGLYHYLEKSSAGECAAEEAIIIETIHKSKGLEYDVVILVNEDKTVRSERRISPLLDHQGKAEWILEPIKKELMQVDPELNQLHQQSESQQGFGSLCTLYVGMTRAKRALYMISDFDRVSKGSTVHFLREQFGNEADHNGILWQTGDPNFFEQFSKKEADRELKGESSELTQSEQTLQTAQNKKEKTTHHFSPAHPRLKLARPSQVDSSRASAEKYFDLEETSSDFGTAVHAVFEQIEWLVDESAPLNFHSPPHTSEKVIQTVQNCLNDSEIKKLFTSPSTPTEVLRERAFSYVEGDQFINGVFDRVHIHKDADGKTTRAEIIDFKTDRIHKGNTIEQAAKYHRPQLEAYRKALSKTLGLNEAVIQLSAVFTDIPSRIQL